MPKARFHSFRELFAEYRQVCMAFTYIKILCAITKAWQQVGITILKTRMRIADLRRLMFPN